MSELENTDYSKFKGLSTIAMLSVAFVASDANTVISLEKSFLSSYTKSGSYESAKQSTVDDAIIKNDISMLKLLEIEGINKKIKNIFDTRIVEHWIPADGLLDKTCLFIRVENQEGFISKTDYDYDFELDLYLKLQEEINNSNFFNMIALL